MDSPLRLFPWHNHNTSSPTLNFLQIAVFQCLARGWERGRRARDIWAILIFESELDRGPTNVSKDQALSMESILQPYHRSWIISATYRKETSVLVSISEHPFKLLASIATLTHYVFRPSNGCSATPIPQAN